MRIEFHKSINPKELLVKVRDFQVRGALHEARSAIEEALTDKPNLGEHVSLPNADWTELYTTAAAIYDRLGEYDIARDLVGRWASEIQFTVLELLRSARESGSGVISKATEDSVEPAVPHPGAISGQSADLWYVRILFLQQYGIAMYRISQFDAARGYLKDALLLSEFLLASLRMEAHKHSIQGERRPEEIVSAYANTCYWLGCVETYANEFDDAERYFISGLKAISDEFAGGSHQIEQNRMRCARVTGRLLLGLGLLRLYKGALAQARSDLLAARILFAEEPGEIIRKLRAELLLLAVDRAEFSDNKTKLLNVLSQLEILRDRFDGRASDSQPGVTRHDRYFSRTMWTIGLVKLDLADLYWRPGDPPNPEIDEGRTRLLMEALEIAESKRSRAHGSHSDQLQLDILKVRALRRLQRFEEAIHWGTFCINRPETLDHPLLHTEVLISVGHACFNLWQSQKRSEHLLQAESLISAAADKSTKNPRAQAVCKLHLARIAYALGQSTRAEKEFEIWTYMARVIDKVRWIELFSRRVRAELDSSEHDSFVFKLSEMPESNAYDEINRRLRSFLLKRVAADMNNKDAAAAKLGVSRQTLYSWAHEIKNSANSQVKTLPIDKHKHKQ